MHTSTSNNNTNNFQNSAAAPACLEVIDPCNRTGKIVIPVERVIETKGMTEVNRPRESRDLSLCLLFQKGRCNAAARCHQIHADADYVNKLRAQAQAGTACCAFHGDFQSSTYLTQSPRTVEVFSGSVAGIYSIVFFGRTSALDALLSHNGGTIRVNASKVCRLHAEGRCKFGRDCKNIHLCPTAKPMSPQPQFPAAASAPPLATFVRPVFAKSVGHLEINRNELEASSICGLSSCPDSPSKSSFRSGSSCAASTVVSPAPTDSGVANRMAALKEAAAAQPAAPIPHTHATQQGEYFIVQPLTVLAVPGAIARPGYGYPPVPASMDHAAFEAVLSWPLLSLGSVASPMAFCPPGFHGTASLVAADLANTAISPSWPN